MAKRIPNFPEYLAETSPYRVIPWHQKLMAKECHEVFAGAARRLMILAPVQHLKSSTVSDRGPSYYLGLDPRRHVLLTAYGASLASRGHIENRRTIQNEYWQETFGYRIGEKSTQTELIMDVPGQDGRNSLISAPINGSIAGHAVDIGIIDDECRNRSDALSPKVRTTIKDNYYSVIAPRSKKIILCTTPWHLDGLAFSILRQAHENKSVPQWRLLVLAATNDEGKDSYIEDTATGQRWYLDPYDALWPEVHPRSELDELKATMRDTIWQSLYMCRPTMGGNCLFPRDKWGLLGNAVPLQINWAWDFASGKTGAKNDYTVGCCVALMNTGRYAVLDLFRGKPDFTMMKQLVFEKWSRTYDKYRLYAQVFIEDASAGQQMLQEIANFNLRNDSLIRPIPVIPTHSKEMRAEAIASAQNNGQVDLPEDAVWQEAFIRELEEFPLSEHDDCVDAYTWAQAGFVRGEGFFKQPALPPGAGESVQVYDAMEARDWAPPDSSFKSEANFDMHVHEAEAYLRWKDAQ
jgi:predicted phage terminase large subunit-like protein